MHESGNSNKRDRDGSLGSGFKIRNARIFGVQIRGLLVGNGNDPPGFRLKRSTETLPPPPLCTTCGKPHPGVCYKATRGCFTCGSTQHKVKDCPQGKQKQTDGIIRDPSKIKEAQRDDGELWAIVQNVEDGKHTEFSVDDDSVVWFEDRLCVPNDQALREKVMTEAHSSPFTIHPGSTQNVKRFEHIGDPFMWKWMRNSMDFVTGLPTTQKRHDAIWVVVDRLTKSAHFLPIRKNYGISKLAEIFRQEIVRPACTAFHPQTDEVVGMNNWSCTFELLYGRKCRAPICWDEVDRDRSVMLISMRREIELQVGDRVFPEGFAIQRKLNDWGQGKLSPPIIVPFVDFGTYWKNVSYCLALPPQFIALHDVIPCISYLGIPLHPLQVAAYPFDQIQLICPLSEEPEFHSVIGKRES
ncbi:retrotransposon protein, putative, ty3-gypsy subclass [Tanacetum coccineum]